MARRELSLLSFIITIDYYTRSFVFRTFSSQRLIVFIILVYPFEVGTIYYIWYGKCRENENAYYEQLKKIPIYNTYFTAIKCIYI